MKPASNDARGTYEDYMCVNILFCSGFFLKYFECKHIFCSRPNESLNDLPNKVFAVTAEGWVLEEPGDKLVVLDLVDVLLLEGAFALPVDVTLFAALHTIGLLIVVGAHVVTLKEEFELLIILIKQAKKNRLNVLLRLIRRDFPVSPSPTSPSK